MKPDVTEFTVSTEMQRLPLPGMIAMTSSLSLPSVPEGRTGHQHPKNSKQKNMLGLTSVFITTPEP